MLLTKNSPIGVRMQYDKSIHCRELYNETTKLKKNMHINIKQTTTAYKKHHQALAYQQIPIGVQKCFKLQSRTKRLEKLQNE